MFPVYVSTLDDIIVSTLQSVLQTSGCGEAEVVIFVLDKYHCILLDGLQRWYSYGVIDVLISFHGVL
jgi:hypothetical protein